MTPRRRAMMGSHRNAKNYLFKEGRGLKEDLVYHINDNGGASGSVSNGSIFLCGGDSYDGMILLAHEIGWKQWATDNGEPLYVLDSVSLDLSNYTTLCVDMKCRSNVSRQHALAIIDEEQNGKTSPAGIRKEQIGLGTGYSVCERFYDTTETRQIYTLDIADIDIGTIAICSGDYTTMTNTIYNIWLE